MRTVLHESLRGLLAAAIVAATSVTAQTSLAQSRATPDVADWVGDQMDEHDLVLGEACIGSFDYLAAGEDGLTAVGWVWDSEAETAPESILLVDAQSEIVGYATSGVERLDVPEALPEVTAEDTGWTGALDMDDVPESGVFAYGLSGDDAICLLGEKTALDD